MSVKRWIRCRVEVEGFASRDGGVCLLHEDEQVDVLIDRLRAAVEGEFGNDATVDLMNDGVVGGPPVETHAQSVVEGEA